MFRRNGEASWPCSLEFDVAVSFCVWVLQHDGLTIPPFDQHGQGDQVLRRAGLTAAAWRSWLEAVIRQREISGELMERAIAGQEQWAAVEATVNPTVAWTGAAAVKAMLEDLWTSYNRGAGATWKRRQTEQFSPAALHPLWPALRPFHARLAALQVYFVDYPWIVSYPVPPHSLLLVCSQTT